MINTPNISLAIESFIIEIILAPNTTPGSPKIKHIIMNLLSNGIFLKYFKVAPTPNATVATL